MRANPAAGRCSVASRATPISTPTNAHLNVHSVAAESMPSTIKLLTPESLGPIVFDSAHIKPPNVYVIQ